MASGLWKCQSPTGILKNTQDSRSLALTLQLARTLLVPHAGPFYSCQLVWYFKWSWNLVLFGGVLHQRVTPSSHIWPFTATCNSSSMGSRDLFWTPKVSAFMCTEICTYTHGWIESKNLKDKTKAFRASCPTPCKSLSRQFIPFIFPLCQVLPRAPFTSLPSRCLSGLAVRLSVCFTVMKVERREDSLWE